MFHINLLYMAGAFHKLYAGKWTESDCIRRWSMTWYDDLIIGWTSHHSLKPQTSRTCQIFQKCTRSLRSYFVWTRRGFWLSDLRWEFCTKYHILLENDDFGDCCPSMVDRITHALSPSINESYWIAFTEYRLYHSKLLGNCYYLLINPQQWKYTAITASNEIYTPG